MHGQCPLFSSLVSGRPAAGLFSPPLACIKSIAPSLAIPVLQINRAHTNGRLQRLPKAYGYCGTGRWRTEGQGT
jgi:hypothetical protein